MCKSTVDTSTTRCRCNEGANPAAFAGYPLIVTMSPGLNLHSIEHVQSVEKQLDAALLPCGYARSTSSKGGNEVVFNYYQCAVMEDV